MRGEGGWRLLYLYYDEEEKLRRENYYGREKNMVGGKKKCVRAREIFYVLHLLFSLVIRHKQKFTAGKTDRQTDGRTLVVVYGA